MISIPAVLREIRGFPAGNANFLRKCHARLNMLPQRHFIIAFFLQFASTKLTILSLFYFRDGPDIPHHFRCLLIFTGESDSYGYDLPSNKYFLYIIFQYILPVMLMTFFYSMVAKTIW